MELTNHAEDKLPIGEVDKNLVVGRIKGGHCAFYYEDTHSFEAYFSDHKVAANFVTEYENLQKNAIVKSVFEVGDAHSRYSGDRFEYLD